MKKRIMGIVFLCMAAMLPGAGSFPALAASAYEVALDILVKADTSKPVTPRETVPFELTVENRLGESWIRVSVTASSKGIGNTFSDADVKFAEGWVKRGEYYYRTEKAAKKSRIPAIESFTVPDVKSSSGGTLTLSVYAEAIQAGSVKPDFNLDDPWKGKSPQAAASYTRGGTGQTGCIVSPESGLTRYAAPQSQAYASSGKWYLVDDANHLWKYGDAETKTYASDGWYYLYNGYSRRENRYQWFYFDKNGIMAYGWLNPSGNDWYHLHEKSDGDLGSMDTGFFTDPEDGRTYYLDEGCGLMAEGWKTIREKQYYFAKITEIPAANWFYKLIGNTGVGRWVYNRLGLRTYGSMYRDERTPEGKYVDADGVLKT